MTLEARLQRVWDRVYFRTQVVRSPRAALWAWLRAAP